MNDIIFLQKALNSGASNTGTNIKYIEEYVRRYGHDKRYKIMFFAKTSSWAYNESGKISYRGVVYWYQQSKDSFKVRRKYDDLYKNE